VGGESAPPPPATLSEQHVPFAIVGLHGVLAAVTLVLVLLGRRGRRR
jgi:hypothetical protein